MIRMILLSWVLTVRDLNIPNVKWNRSFTLVDFLDLTIVNQPGSRWVRPSVLNGSLYFALPPLVFIVSTRLNKCVRWISYREYKRTWKDDFADSLLPTKDDEVRS